MCDEFGRLARRARGRYVPLPRTNLNTACICGVDPHTSGLTMVVRIVSK